MSVITESPNDLRCDPRTGTHSHCVVCGAANDHGLRLKFSPTEDGSVQARFYCDKTLEGYADILHGGVISSLLDGAMTNCLFAHGHPGLTAELTVRFRHPVRIGTAATVRAWIERCSPPLHVLRAELVQDEQVKATGCGKFMDRKYVYQQ